MDGEDRTGRSAEELDRLARGVLRAARDAARELRKTPPDEARRTWALGKLAGRTQEMLGPDMPDDPPVGVEAQEEFVRTALALAVHVRAHSWAEADLGLLGVRGHAELPHSGESLMKDAFDVLGRLMLPDSSPEGWTATLVTDLADGDKALENAVHVGKYILHPTFLTFLNDATRITGEALHNINVSRLHELTDSLRHCAGAEELLHTPTLAQPADTPESTPSAQLSQESMEPWRAPMPLEHPRPPRAQYQRRTSDREERGLGPAPPEPSPPSPDDEPEPPEGPGLRSALAVLDDLVDAGETVSHEPQVHSALAESGVSCEEETDTPRVAHLKRSDVPGRRLSGRQGPHRFRL
ncbi:hypothetical protein [Streptomyces sp. NPDC001492]